MKKTFVFLLSLLTLVSCYDDSALREQMQAFEDRLADLEGSKISSINDQIAGITESIDSLRNVDSKLKIYIDDLEDLAGELEDRIASAEADVAELESDLASAIAAIEELKAYDRSLDEKIALLLAYVDDSLKADKDWADATFATLEQYESVQSTLAELRESLGRIEDGVESLESEFGQQLADAISASESGMKTWVNEHLAGSYYDITEVDARLSALEAAYKDADASLKENIAAQQKALEQAREELTAEYEKAISDAIRNNNGVLDSKIADAVKTAQESLQEQIDAIGVVVASLEERLAILESDLVGRIQSLAYVPEYTDGKVVVAEGDGVFSLKFLVAPSRLAASLQTLWETDGKVITAGLCYSKNPATRAASKELVPLKVTSVTATSEGMLHLTISVDEENPLRADFWEGDVSALAYIHITDGNNDLTSGMIVLEGRKGSAFPDHTELPIPGPGIPSGVSMTANSYIISEAGSYTIRTVKGNSTESVGAVASAEVLWESFGTDEAPEAGDLIASVSYFNGRIGFTTGETFREGNAVIAARDSDGNILWSWHIWMTDQPKEQVYYNGAGTMMDRNLGATSATPGDVGALGLLYQWGRKDPFLGSSSIRESVVAQSTLTWPSPVASDNSNGTIDFTILNPTTFVTYNENNYDWYYTGNGTTDNTRWVEPNNPKTIYDPCPVGWCVPDGGDDGVWAQALGSSSDFVHTFDFTCVGMNFSGKFGSDQTVWYPSAGFFDGYDGNYYIAYTAAYWSASPGEEKTGADVLAFYDSECTHHALIVGRAAGYPVRCMKEGSRTGSGSGGSDTPGGSEGGSGSYGNNVDIGTSEDIASNLETANSYIVTRSGSYKFKAYKGNSQDLAGSSSSVDPVGEIAKAEVLWESFGTSETPEVGALITDVAYEYPYVGFKTAGTFREGNAVIAVRDASDNILWSWHIWMTDYPVEQVYYNGAGTMMDRNLGATSATPGDVGALGLLYQWGRKDPFLGSSSISEAVEAKSTITWPSPVASDASTGTIEYAAANPTTFIFNEGGNYDWYYTGDITTDDTRWVESNQSKTIYDPCPVGWRVPDGGEDGVWRVGVGPLPPGFPIESLSLYDSRNIGMNFCNSLGQEQVTWYPLTSTRAHYNGVLGFDFWGISWSSSFYSDICEYDCFGFTDEYLWTNIDYCGSYGFSVRCMKEGSRSSLPSTPDPTPDPTPEPDPDTLIDYVDEYGINHGTGVKIGETVWAPVNCGYHATDFKWGKLYQWGRKYGQGYSGDLYDGDGNLAGTVSDQTLPEIVNGGVSLDTAVSELSMNIFYLGVSNRYYDWLSSYESDIWNVEEEAPVKTDNDPCPSGWRVPTRAELEVLFQNHSWDNNVNGVIGTWFSGESSYSQSVPQIFLPAAGVRNYDDGYTNGRGLLGQYWSSTPEFFNDSLNWRIRQLAVSFSFDQTSVESWLMGPRAGGYSVRCVQEQ